MKGLCAYTVEPLWSAIPARLEAKRLDFFHSLCILLSRRSAAARGQRDTALEFGPAGGHPHADAESARLRSARAEALRGCRGAEPPDSEKADADYRTALDRSRPRVGTLGDERAHTRLLREARVGLGKAISISRRR